MARTLSITKYRKAHETRRVEIDGQTYEARGFSVNQAIHFLAIQQAGLEEASAEEIEVMRNAVAERLTIDGAAADRSVVGELETDELGVVLDFLLTPKVRRQATGASAREVAAEEAKLRPFLVETGTEDPGAEEASATPPSTSSSASTGS